MYSLSLAVFYLMCDDRHYCIEMMNCNAWSLYKKSMALFIREALLRVWKWFLPGSFVTCFALLRWNRWWEDVNRLKNWCAHPTTYMVSSISNRNRGHGEFPIRWVTIRPVLFFPRLYEPRMRYATSLPRRGTKQSLISRGISFPYIPLSIFPRPWNVSLR